MKTFISFLSAAALAFCSLASVEAQSSSPRSKPAATTKTESASDTATPAESSVPARTDVYHVHFVKAALGKATQLADDLKAPDPQEPKPGHTMILRHQEGDAWDYAVIQHMGTTATVAAARPTPAASVRELSDWHNDTLVSGPSWAEFSKAMGIDESDKSKTKDSVYVISVYRPAAGHRDQLEKMLSAEPSPGDTTAGSVLMRHLEGAPWTFLTIARYNSWQDFGKNESNSVATTSKNEGGWFQLREHASYHTDTLADRLMP